MHRPIPLFALIAVACLTAVVSAEKVVVVAGGGTGGSGSKATDAKLGQVFGAQFDPAGNLWVVEYSNRLWKIDTAGVITAVAGDGTKGNKGDGGPATAAQLNVPHSLAIDKKTGDVYIGDTGNYTVRKIDAKTGIMSTFAGTGTKGTSGNGGLASAATFGGLYCVQFDPQCEHLVLADLDHKQVRVIDMKTGKVTLAAGNGQRGAPADGADAAASPLADPRAAAMDAAGNLYILERGVNALRVVTPDGKIKTVAGSGKKGSGGDGGPALAAEMNGPKHIWVEADGNVLIADAENHLIRRYDVKTQKIERVAGTGKAGTAGVGGDPKQAELKRPHGIYQSPDGTLYISDSYNGRVLRIEK
ncbi:NHL repeat-containing protein [Humisphaera borealis]|uniref:Teneurin NHL domain-containing protein n=1 Tax=Humisphaera borealis TaxID=2807512 RepID=A0A7M2X3B6_9BACT|nr:hypothetical protein [Humisphaera borealis]QOV92248.1 hypothetical protein IPV69_13185 [Humisphaera borealis]